MFLNLSLHSFVPFNHPTTFLQEHLLQCTGGTATTDLDTSCFRAVAAPLPALLTTGQPSHTEQRTFLQP